MNVQENRRGTGIQFNEKYLSTTQIFFRKWELLNNYKI